MRLVAGALVTVVVLWLVFVVALVIVRPRGMNLRETRQVIPDTILLLRSMYRDRELPSSVRRWLRVLLVYVALPIDVIPDFVPLLGYADDVIVVAFVLRRVVRRAGPDALDRHWPGSAAGLDAIRRLAGLRS